jgi:hypothetical protein
MEEILSSATAVVQSRIAEIGDVSNLIPWSYGRAFFS